MKVYFAGRISQEDWRHTFFPTLRGASVGRAANGSIGLLDAVLPMHRHVVYGGPYFVSCDHGCYHSGDSGWSLGFGSPHDPESFKGYESRHAMTNGCMGKIATRAEVVALCRGWIEQSEAVFAWIEDTEAYGTIAELGYAAALGKPIWLYESPLLSEELWFIRELATIRHAALTAEEAVQDFIRETGDNPVSERAFCDEIEETLFLGGWDVQREVPVPGGRIDIVANCRGRQVVIEAKMRSNQRSVRDALGQLLVYGHYREGAELFFASPEPVSDGLATLLERHSIKVFNFASWGWQSHD